MRIFIAAILLFSLCVFSLFGCATSLMSHEPVTRRLALQGTPQSCYAQAAQAFLKLGGHPQIADPQARVIAGIVHNAVQLNVTVSEQCEVQVSGRVLSGKLALGSFTEVDEYIAILQQRS